MQINWEHHLVFGGFEHKFVLCVNLLHKDFTIQSTDTVFSLSAAKRLKKGMATAKQRLGKILKIHRNGKLLL